MSQVLVSKMGMEKGAHEKKKKGEEKVAGHITEREMSMKSAFSPLIGRKREELYWEGEYKHRQPRGLSSSAWLLAPTPSSSTSWNDYLLQTVPAPLPWQGIFFLELEGLWQEGMDSTSPAMSWSSGSWTPAPKTTLCKRQARTWGGPARR